MKNLFIILALMLAFGAVSQAQTVETTPRVIIGGTGGSSFGNAFLGLTTAVEIPVKNRFEFDVVNTFSPVESHIALGHGWAEEVNGGGIVWLTRQVGLNGSASYSRYNVTISKAAPYIFGGVTIRTIAYGVPVRFQFDYVREVNNGIFPDNVHGTETGHLQAGDFKMDARLSCNATGRLCLRTVFDFLVGHVLNQGNPVCDSTFGTTGGPGGGSCPRHGVVSGGVTFGIALEIRRKQDFDNVIF